MDCPKLKGILDRHGMTVAPFSRWHLRFFDVVEASGGLGAVIADYETYITIQASFGPTYSVLGPGPTTVGIFGAVQLWPGVGEAWALPGHEARRRPVDFVRASRVILDQLADIGNFRRLQCYVRASHNSSVQFAKVCYFGQEARLSRFGPEGADYFLFARFRE